MKHEIPASCESRCLLLHTACSEQRRGWGFHAYKWSIGPSENQAKADVCFSKQRAPSTDLRWWEEQNDEARSVSDIASK